MKTLRAMSFNIRLNVAGDGPNVWPHRKDLAASMLHLHQPDIVGLQEALPDQVDDLAARLPDFAWVGVGREDGARKGEFAAIFYRCARLTLLDQGTFWLSKAPDVPGSLGWDAACVRIATWAKLRDMATDAEFFFYNTHFDHVGAIARRESARLLLKDIAARTGALPAIVVGDLNCDERATAYRWLTDGVKPIPLRLRDAKTQAATPHHGPSGTFHAFTGVLRERIDYIFVTEGIRVLRHATLADYWDGRRYPSDHMPVLADVILEDLH
ncbi:MAG TPA: endonuclease/exonuclease/phosphatase family protein [Anaerolineae bacterium]|nr:endonuclease/exonuclease/phosphatase family protein [Anaerolineae bacterium]HQI83914.1 endonuclease/exonuclease/phosphatase family protein [Anaerolineae bacterium]